MTFRPELIDELLKEYQNPEDLMGEGGILKQLTKALVERCLTAEIDNHLQSSHSDYKRKIVPDRGLCKANNIILILINDCKHQF